MADNTPQTPTPKKEAKPRKLKLTKPRKQPTKHAEHPKYSVMIAAAVTSLKERGGSSRQAIIKYIFANYKVGIEIAKINARVKTALKAGVKAGTLKQTKGTGASGSFRLGEKKAASQPKKPKAKKPKKPASKKTAKSPKKKAAAKPAKKSPAKKAAAKPKKSPAKKAAAKPKKTKAPKKAAAQKAA